MSQHNFDSLLHQDPADDAWYSGNYQMGLAIVSSPRLASTFIAYKKNQLKEEDALDLLEEDEGDIEYEWDSDTTDSGSDAASVTFNADPILNALY